MSNVLVGRQPIYNANLDVIAYELLFRSHEKHDFASFEDGDLATSQLLLTTFLDIGIDNIVGNKPAYINMTRNHLLDNPDLPLNKEQVVLEILEDVEIDEAVINKIQELSKHGYQIALDDFVFEEKHDQLLPYVNIIKIDILNLSRQQVEEEAMRLKPYRIKLLAEKIESQDEFEFCKSLGFDYFQGFFLSRPKTISGQRIPTNRAAILDIMSYLYNDDLDLSELEHRIAQDVSLGYRLLRYVNSSYYSLPTKVQSLHHAIVILGLKTIRQCVTMITMAGVNDKPNYLISTALIRAKMCEKLGEMNGGEDVNAYFTAGLFSNLDVLLDIPMDQILANLPLAERISVALLQRQGDIGTALECVINYEQGLWDRLPAYNIDAESIRDCYLQAIQWSNEVMGELRQAA